jgi:hypothetical protein
MRSKKTWGIILAIVGIILIFISMYINKQIAEGKIQISEGQKKIDRTEGLFSLNPVTKEFGKGVTGSGQKQIDEGNLQVAHYSKIATGLKVGGVILIILGAGIYFVGRRKQ